MSLFIALMSQMIHPNICCGEKNVQNFEKKNHILRSAKNIIFKSNSSNFRLYQVIHKNIKT